MFLDSELLVLTGTGLTAASGGPLHWQLESGSSPSPRGVGSNDPETAAAVLSKEKRGANSKLLTMKSSDMRSNRLGRTEWRFWHDSAASVQKTSFKTMLGSLPVEQSLFGSLASGASHQVESL